ncbi:AK17A protein, partial [Amia calva]|nr:AK17A protein [Amia calva]
MAATIVHDSSEAVELCGSRRLYLKPIAKLAITVLWPGLREQSKAVSNWEVMAKLKQMAHPHQFTSIRVSKSALEFVRFEAEVETRALVQTLCVKMNGRLLEAQGSDSALRVLAVESSPEFPSRQEWDDYFQGGEERPDTVHLEGLPCKWFSSPDSYSQKPREEIVREVFGRFGHLRNMDIPALDVYREEMAGRSSSVFSFAGLQTFDVYLQFEEYEDFLRAMESLRGMRLMLKEGDGKALACNIKVTFDMTSHLSEAAVARRQRERKQLEELEEQRQREKRREREEEEADR